MFYDEIVKQFEWYSSHNTPLKYSSSSNNPARVVYQSLLKDLKAEETKRFIFDARQATLFGDIDEEPDGNMLAKIHAPFPQFYCEFTEPIFVGEQEPGIEGVDAVRSFFYREGALTANIRLPNSDEQHTFIMDHCTFFLVNSQGDYVDRSFKIIKNIGRAAVTKQAALANPDPSVFTSEISENMDPTSYFISGYGLEDEETQLSWKVGWWERLAQQYTSLTLWVMAYCMAKSINITEIPLSRQQRRWHEANNLIPRPWHKVELKPKFSRYVPSNGDIKFHQNYRYDVVGHLRFARHRHADGSYTENIEWVSPHQRGLAHETYIPKTYQVKGNKQIDPAMKQYWRNK